MSVGLSAKVPRDLGAACSSKDFQLWIESFQNYLCVVEIDITLDSAQKHALLKNCIGEDGLRIISGLEYDKSKNPFENLVSALTAHFVPKTNLTYERYRFRSLYQTESVQSFINNLHAVAKDCDFGNSKIDSIYNQNIRDQLIIGLQSDALRKILLSETNLTLEKALAKALAFESSVTKAEEMRSSVSKQAEKSEHNTDTVLAMKAGPKRSAVAMKGSKRKQPLCYFCGKPGHFQANCFKKQESSSSSSMVCDFCHKRGHTRDKCFRLLRESTDSASKPINLMLGLESNPKSCRPKPKNLKQVTCSFYDCEAEGLVDSGASISVISKQFIQRHNLSKAVEKADHSAIAANQTKVEFKQSIKGPLAIGNKLLEAEFFVAPWLEQDCILGMDILSEFRSIRFSDEGDDLLLTLLPEAISEFSDIFDKKINDSCCDLPAHPIIEITGENSPHQSKVRKLSPRDEKFCEEQVSYLLAEGIIRKSRSAWRHAPVVVPKRTGGFRLAIDYRPVNSVTRADAFPIPNIRDLLEGLHGSRVFSTLDFSQFYYQLPLHPSDIEKSAFYAAGDLYEFVRCPFGLKNAVSLCSRIMKQIFGDMKGVAIYLDDLLIHAENKQKHDEILRSVLARIRSHNLSLNMKKCSFYRDKVTFLGHEVGDGKISPDPERVSSILHFPTPSTVRQLERFLGMTNYFRNYLHCYSDLAKILYDMVKAGSMKWTDEALRNFNSIKESLSQAILVLPSPDEKLVLSTDASQECIGACLATSEGRPVAFASKKLTEAETRWSTIDKEAYAIVWSIKKLRTLLLGRKFIVRSDHQPLKYLFEARDVSAKVSRWRVGVAEFDFEVEYMKGSNNLVADSLSRMYMIAVDEQCDIDMPLDQVRRAQELDEEIRTLSHAIRSGMRKRPSSVSRSYWSLRSKLRIQDGFLLYNDKYVIPKSLREKLVAASHYGHQGSELTVSKLSESYFWPGLRRDVKEFIRSCRICSLVRPNYINAHLKPFLLDAPLQLVATDYIGPLPSDHGYRYLLVIIDAFSRFPEAYPVRDMTVPTLITAFRDYFARYGFPDAILSDRGTQFQSREFNEYLANFGVKKLATTAYRPSANGICERFNGTLQTKIKALLAQRQLTPREWTQVLPVALMAVRNDKHATTGFKPTELFFSFRVKDLSLPPISDRHLELQLHGGAARNIAQRRLRVRRRFQDRRFDPGSTVLLRRPQTRKLQLSGTEAKVVRQVDSHVLDVEAADGHISRVSTARVSPVPATRPTRQRRPPPYLSDYLTGEDLDRALREEEEM